MGEILVWKLFHTRVRSEESVKSISAAAVSEVSEEARFTAVGVSEVMLFLMKGVLLLSECGFVEVVEIPIGESGELSPMEKRW